MLENNEKPEVVEEVQEETSQEVEIQEEVVNDEDINHDVFVDENVKEESKARKIVRWSLWGVFGAIFTFLVVVVGWLTIDKYIIKNPVPSFAGYSHLTITTGSMSGTIDVGDVVIIKKTGEYKNGDIVTYLKEGDKIPTTHRIIYTYGENFICKGDANNHQDTESVHISEIKGEVIEVLPKFGIFIDWVKKGGGLIYIIAIIAIIGAGVYVIKKD